jgi:ketosteroid isomerase-like protein
MIPDYDDFAREWEAAWNAHDLDRIMAHYTDDIVFRSRKAVEHMGTGEMHGQTQLRAYWAAALKKQPDLRFEVQSVLGGYDMAVIVYRNNRGVLAAETLYFRADGLVERAAACHETAVT